MKDWKKDKESVRLKTKIIYRGWNVGISGGMKINKKEEKKIEEIKTLENGGKGAGREKRRTSGQEGSSEGMRKRKKQEGKWRN